MRLGWGFRLPGPFYIGGTIWRSRRRRPHRKYFYHGTCTIQHRTFGAAARCRGMV